MGAGSSLAPFKEPALTSDACKLASLFATRTSAAADAPYVAAVMAAAWMAIDRALRVVIGAQGAAALYTRSLHLAARDHPWLLEVWKEGDRKIDIARLRVEMSKRNVDEAARAARGLLETFDQLFSSLVGESLTEQLLRSVFEEPWGEAPDEVRTS